MNVKALIAEFIGTFTLIFIGVGSIIVTKNGGLVGIAFAHGIAIAVMASATAAISGGHLNPAVSFGAWVGGKLSLVNMIGYWIAQVAGGAVGALALYAGGFKDVINGVPVIGPSTTPVQGMVLEAIGTFFLVFVVYGTAIDKRAPKVAALMIGLTITISILCFGPITGCSINPARWLGPALATGSAIDRWNLLIYLVGPLVGGLAAGLIYGRFLVHPDDEPLVA